MNIAPQFQDIISHQLFLLPLLVVYELFIREKGYAQINKGLKSLKDREDQTIVNNENQKKFQYFYILLTTAIHTTSPFYHGRLLEINTL